MDQVRLAIHTSANCDHTQNFVKLVPLLLDTICDFINTNRHFTTSSIADHEAQHLIRMRQCYNHQIDDILTFR